MGFIHKDLMTVGTFLEALSNNNDKPDIIMNQSTTFPARLSFHKNLLKGLH